MNTYVALIRGINVGGKNKVPMAVLRARLQEAGFKNVTTYIASGNVILDSDQSASQVREQIEQLLRQFFSLRDELVKVLVLDHIQLRDIVANKPSQFGENPLDYHSDVIFLIDISTTDAIKIFQPREGVDTIWPGRGVIYSQRLSTELTKSRLSKILLSPLYKSMTIRSWNTVTKLLTLIEQR